MWTRHGILAPNATQRRQYACFIELIGDKPLREVQREDALRFRSDLAEICSDWGQSKQYAAPVEGNPNRRVSARQAVEISKVRPRTDKRLSPKTVNKQVGPLNQIWNWAVENAGCNGLPHPFNKLQKKPKGASRRSAAREARDAFRIGEIQCLFASELWQATSPFADDSHQSLNAKPKPMLYFGLLLAIYEGLRLSEICQLRVGDIRPMEGFHVIDIRRIEDAEYAAELGAGRHTRIIQENKVKTAAADRQVPLHPVLVRCGFLEYLQLRSGRPSDLLFLDASRSRAKRALSDFFMDLRRELGLNRPKLSFHSLRHSARTMLDSIVGDSSKVDLIIGHDDITRASEVRLTYNKGHWLRPLYDDLAKLTYGIAAFGESGELIDQMRRDGFVLTL